VVLVEEVPDVAVSPEEPSNNFKRSLSGIILASPPNLPLRL
jgi:hypothetical protein